MIAGVCVSGGKVGSGYSTHRRRASCLLLVRCVSADGVGHSPRPLGSSYRLMSFLVHVRRGVLRVGSESTGIDAPALLSETCDRHMTRGDSPCAVSTYVACTGAQRPAFRDPLSWSVAKRTPLSSNKQTNKGSGGWVHFREPSLAESTSLAGGSVCWLLHRAPGGWCRPRSRRGPIR